jgi:hypothetical protein
VNVPTHQSAAMNGVHFTIDRGNGNVVVKAVDGQFKPAGDSLTVTNAQGAVVDSIPLTYRKDNTQFPIKADVVDHQVTLTPQTTGGIASPNPISANVLSNLKPVDKVDPKSISESFTPRDQQELSAFGSRATISSLVGAVIGALIGVTTGCIAGGLLGTAIGGTVVALLGGLPGALVGCIAGIAIVGSVGSLLGTLLVGGPLVLWAAYQYFSTITSPCITPGAFCTDPANPPAPKH